MTTIPHRELRNNSAEILRRVAAGESMVITNHGEPVAELIPTSPSRFDRLKNAGHVREARIQGGFSSLPRVAGLSSKEVLDDLRGDR